MAKRRRVVRSNVFKLRAGGVHAFSDVDQRSASLKLASKYTTEAPKMGGATTTTLYGDLAHRRYLIGAKQFLKYLQEANPVGRMRLNWALLEPPLFSFSHPITIYAQ